MLAAALASGSGDKLLVLDEQFPGGVSASAQLHCVTNRCDIARSATAAGIACTLNDFDLSAAPMHPAQIYYRISKEKAVVNHVLDQSLAALASGGVVHLAGHKNEGIRGAAKRLAAVCDARVIEKKGPRSAWLAQIKPVSRASGKLDAADYARLREHHVEPWPPFLTKPGIFGWNKIDDGSALLATQLPALMESHKVVRALDLGCGYGFLGLEVGALADVEIVATDNNVAAVLACRANFERRGIRGEALLVDCGDSVAGSFDLVVCNPPFHRGFAVDINLIDRFVAVAQQRLTRDGRALFVVHRTVHLASRAAACFERARVLASDARFEVVELSGARL